MKKDVKSLREYCLKQKGQRTTSGFTQAGAQLVRHFVSNSLFFRFFTLSTNS